MNAVGIDISIGAFMCKWDNPMCVLAPFISADSIEEEAQRLLTEYGFSEAVDTPLEIDPAQLVERIGLTIQYRQFNKESHAFGAISWKAVMPHSTSLTWTLLCPNPFGRNEKASQKRPTGSVNNTIAHKCVHWYRHRKACYFAGLITGSNSVVCEVDSIITADRSKIRANMEWQANALAARLLMPYPAFTKKVGELIESRRQAAPDTSIVDLLEPVIDQPADIFKVVSQQTAKISLVELCYLSKQHVIDYCFCEIILKYSEGSNSPSTLPFSDAKY